MTEVNAFTVTSVLVISEYGCGQVYTDETGYKGFRSFIQKCPQAPVVLYEIHQ